MVLKALADSAPKYITEFLVRYTPTRNLRSSEGNLLVIPSSRATSYGGKRLPMQRLY